MKALALVPVRSGSKGIKEKNTRDFCGKPLYRWAVDVGLATCDATWVTTDIPGLVLPEGAWKINRPPELCADDTPMLAVVQHALKTLDGDVVVLLQPTQPLRTVKHVREALWRLSAAHSDSVVSVVPIPAHYSPDYAMKIEDGRLLPFKEPLPTRRQDCRPAYFRDGTVYVVHREVVEAGSLYGRDCCPYILPSGESVNLDTEEDWQRAVAMKGHSDAERKAG